MRISRQFSRCRTYGSDPDTEANSICLRSSRLSRRRCRAPSFRFWRRAVAAAQIRGFTPPATFYGHVGHESRWYEKPQIPGGKARAPTFRLNASGTATRTRIEAQTACGGFWSKYVFRTASAHLTATPGPCLCGGRPAAGNDHALRYRAYCAAGNWTSTGCLAGSSQRSNSSILACSIAVHPTVPSSGPLQI